MDIEDVIKAINTHFDDQQNAAWAATFRRMAADTKTFDRRSRRKYAALAEKYEREGDR